MVRSTRPGMTGRKRTLNTATYVILLAGALAGGFVSGLTGFGTALMALGIWLYVMPAAIAVPKPVSPETNPPASAPASRMT